MKVENRVATVTGGAGGLGRVLTETLLLKGCKVCMLDINTGRGEECLASMRGKFGEDQVTFHYCDITDDNSFAKAFNLTVSKYGQVDIMINNAGIAHERDVDNMLLINLGGTIRGTNLAIKHMRRDEGGRGGVVVNVSSIAGVRPLFALPAYTASKHGVMGFTRSWAENPHLDSMGLRFGLLCPFIFKSFIQTDAKQQLLYTKEHQPIVEESGFEKLEDIAVGLMEILDDDDSNGVMLFTHGKEGTLRKRIEVTDEK